jgi:S1-C subfamily serine protease
MKRSLSLLVAVVALALASLACSLFFSQPAALPPTPKAAVVVPTPVQIVVPPALNQVASQDTLVQLYQKVNPGVVSIRVLTPDGGGQGSGFVVDTEGHIVTNLHVVENLTDLEVAFSDGYKVRGQVVGTDSDSDIAVIKVDAPAERLHPLPLGDSDQVLVGQTVVAIGNPFGFSGTMTTGVVSAKGRTMDSLHQSPGGGTFSAGDIIQTDAAINPGNSGGPLLNLNGEVVGVNRAIYTTSSTVIGEPTSSGIGFAVSINIVKRVLPTLIAGKTYDYPYVGIFSLNDISIIQQEALGLKQTTGVYVTDVVAGSPADKAGVRAGNKPTDITGLMAGGDLITAIDGQPVNNFNEFISYLILNKVPGDTVTLTVLRGAEEINLEVKLDKRPSQ